MSWVCQHAQQRSVRVRAQPRARCMACIRTAAQVVLLEPLANCVTRARGSDRDGLTETSPITTTDLHPRRGPSATTPATVILTHIFFFDVRQRSRFHAGWVVTSGLHLHCLALKFFPFSKYSCIVKASDWGRPADRHRSWRSLRTLSADLAPMRMLSRIQVVMRGREQALWPLAHRDGDVFRLTTYFFPKQKFLKITPFS